MKIVASERCNTHNLHHSLKSIFQNITIYNNRIPHYDATKSDTEQAFTQQ